MIKEKKLYLRGRKVEKKREVSFQYCNLEEGK